MKIAILGNCQAEGIAACMAARVAPNISVEFRSIAGVPLGENAITHEWKAFLSASDVRIVQLTDVQMAGFGLSELKCTWAGAQNFFRIPSLIFKGFQPDCTYIAVVGGAPIEGLMGPYHSAIAAAAYLEGLELRRAHALFNSFTYASLGYFAAYEISCEMLKVDFEAVGFNVQDKLSDIGVFMHTINHPDIRILDILATEVLRISGVKFEPVSMLPNDLLGESYRWPVYSEIANSLGVVAPHNFRRKGAFSSLPEVVSATYDALSKYRSEVGEIILDQDRPAATPVIERAQRFIRQRVI